MPLSEQGSSDTGRRAHSSADRHEGQSLSEAEPQGSRCLPTQRAPGPPSRAHAPGRGVLVNTGGPAGRRRPWSGEQAPGSADAAGSGSCLQEANASASAWGGGDAGPLTWAAGVRAPGRRAVSLQGLTAVAFLPGTLCGSKENTLVFTSQDGRSGRVSVLKILFLKSELAAAAPASGPGAAGVHPAWPEAVQEAHWNWGGNARVYSCAPWGAAAGAGAGEWHLAHPVRGTKL